MVLAAPGPLLTLPLLPPPRRPVTGPTLSKLRSAMETQPRLCRAAAAAAGGVGAREDRTLGRALNQHRRPTTTPATARLCRGLPPTTGHLPSHPPTKQHTWMPLSGRQQTTCSSSSTSSSPSFPQPASSSPHSVCNRRCTHAHKLAFCSVMLDWSFALLSSGGGHLSRLKVGVSLSSLRGHLSRYGRITIVILVSAIGGLPFSSLAAAPWSRPPTAAPLLFMADMAARRLAHLSTADHILLCSSARGRPPTIAFIDLA